MNNIPKQMNAVILKANGDYDNLEYVLDFKTPTPKENEVLVEVKAAGVNNTDINTRIGWYSKNDNSSDDAAWTGKGLDFPLIQGIDVCGIIVAVGENIDKKRVGQRVILEPCLKYVNSKLMNPAYFLGSECNGGFAQYTVVSTEHAHEIKSDYTDIELASFPCSYSTAENLLTRADVKKDDIVLITGASGGVGSAAIQLAKARGAKIIAITSPSKYSDIKKLGAYKTLSRKEPILEQLDKNSVDVVIDLVGGENFNDLLEVLKAKGKYATSGAIGGAIVNLDLRTLYLKDLTLIGGTVLEEGVFSSLVSLIEEKKIKPLVSKVYKLQDIVLAQKEFLEKKHIGKIVLEVK